MLETEKHFSQRNYLPLRFRFVWSFLLFYFCYHFHFSSEKLSADFVTVWLMELKHRSFRNVGLMSILYASRKSIVYDCGIPLDDNHLNFKFGVSSSGEWKKICIFLSLHFISIIFLFVFVRAKLYMYSWWWICTQSSNEPNKYERERERERSRRREEYRDDKVSLFTYFERTSYGYGCGESL